MTGSVEKVPESANDTKKKNSGPPTKVVIRRLPPGISEEEFRNVFDPLPEFTYFHIAQPDASLTPWVYSRAYLNFKDSNEIMSFRDRFDGYVMLDKKGIEYPVMVEFAPWPKVPIGGRESAKKEDAKCGTIDSDEEYKKFLEKLENPDPVEIPSLEATLHEIEAEAKARKERFRGLKTPLIEYVIQRKEERMTYRKKKIENDKRRREEIAKKQQREWEEKKKDRSKRDKEKEMLRRDQQDWDGADKKTKDTKEEYWEDDEAKGSRKPVEFRGSRWKKSSGEEAYGGPRGKSYGRGGGGQGKKNYREDYAQESETKPRKPGGKSYSRQKEEEEYSKPSSSSTRSYRGGRKYREEDYNTPDTSQSGSKSESKEEYHHKEKEEDRAVTKKPPGKSYARDRLRDKQSQSGIVSETNSRVTEEKQSEGKLQEKYSKSSEERSKPDEEGGSLRRNRPRNKDRPEREIYRPGRKKQEDVKDSSIE